MHGKCGQWAFSYLSNANLILNLSKPLLPWFNSSPKNRSQTVYKPILQGNTMDKNNSNTETSKPPPLPNPTSPPGDVRVYLTKLLQHHHGIDEEEAREIASNWKYGRGSDLFYYDVETFRGMFGSEAGMLLYRDIGRGNVRSSRSSDSEEDLFGCPPGCTYPSLIIFSFKLRTR